MTTNNAPAPIAVPTAPKVDLYAAASAFERSGERAGYAALVDAYGDEERRARRAALREAIADLRTYETLRAF